MGHITEESVRDVLSSAGITAAVVTPISATNEPVYEIETGTGERYFAKFLLEEKGAAIAEVLDTGAEIGLPNPVHHYDGRHVLIMDPAVGHPLSYQLPMGVLPGVWTLLSDPLSKSARQVGAWLGRLHEQMRRGTCRVTDEKSRMGNWVVVGNELERYFDDSVVTEITRVFAEIREREFVLTRVHGDPTPHNLYADLFSGESNIIDFNLHSSIAFEDVVVFESGIELMVDRLPYGRPSQKHSLIRSFRAGYLQTGPLESVSTERVRTLQLTYYCHLLNKYLDRGWPNTNRELLTMHLDKRVLRRRILDILER